MHDVSRDMSCDVTDAPVIDCAQTWARVGDVDVKLHCWVKSRPGPTALYWVTESLSQHVSGLDVLIDPLGHWTSW